MGCIRANQNICKQNLSIIREVDILKRCYECKNKLEIKENGYGMWICRVSDKIINLHTNVLCANYKPNK